MMCETGYAIGPIGDGHPADDWMFSNFLWMLMLSLLLFGKDTKPEEVEKEDETDAQQPVPTKPDD